MAPSLSVGGPGTGIYFRTDQKRELDQTALFGEITFDFTDSFSGTLGARWFDEESSLIGVVGWGPGPGAEVPTNSKVSNSDTIYKANLTWSVTDDFMIYGTWSEGYRPGGINRDPNLINTAGTQTWVPDKLTNYEVGLKSTFADGRVRLNSAIYTMDWDDIQYTVYDFVLSACCGNVYNLSTAKVQGFEADLTWVPSDAWTINASVTLNDGETTADFVLPSGLLSVPKGTRLPNVPDLKYSALARYEFPVGNMNYYVQANVSHTGSSTSEITLPVPDRRFPGDNGTYPQEAFTIWNARAGLTRNNWGVDLFLNNFTNEVAQFYVHPRNYEYTVVTNRPMSFGAKYWMRFQ
jgi:outer membrane receptor protein involved in Fe transport